MPCGSSLKGQRRSKTASYRKPKLDQRGFWLVRNIGEVRLGDARRGAARVSNLAKHGMDFADVAQFDFDTALLDFDDREDHGEIRETAIGWCGARLCFLDFVRRNDDEIRVISFRKATKREMRIYAES